MATLSLSAKTLSFFAIFAFFSVCHSLNCTSQEVSNKLFANCSDLSSLNSSLHWTYNATNSSLSVAFSAAPAKSGGWISWGINPTATGMIGTQALIAFKNNSSVIVKTYNLSSYRSVVESQLSFDVWSLSAEEVNGVMTIFASVKVPEKAEEVNQVWQVGAAVSEGRPVKHEMLPENLKAKSVLSLTAATESSGNGTTGSTSNSTSGSSNTTGSGGNGKESSGAREMSVGVFLSFLALVVGSLFVV